MQTQRKKEYKEISELPKKYIREQIARFLKEDIPKKDITTDLFDNKKQKKQYVIIAKQKMVLCGAPIINECFNKECIIEKHKEDGDNIEKGEAIGTISGPFEFVVAGERVMLNLLQRMSGIATYTSDIVKNRKNKKIKILDTRKTTPGIRLFEKYAVYKGGGHNHRQDLSDGILIKENHIHNISSLERAILKAREVYPNKIIEVEVDSLKLAERLAKMDIDAALIDNMSPKQAGQAIQILKSKNKNIFIEVSGGINKTNYQRYMKTGTDAISMGCLTHSSNNADISLK
tara:strand:- start:682 stop:1545 length:864 start_codon:yes stop_codon:yes gene_type:complete